jgi:uncharacterized membrane protein YdjX (TVP38/TMEM64 family)
MNEPAKPKQTLNRKEWVWLISTVAGLVVVYLSPLRDHLTHLRDFKTEMINLGMQGKLFFVAGMFILTSIGVPRLLLFPLGGLAFGFTEGLLLCMAGAMSGAYFVFLYARFTGRGVIVKKWPAVHRVSGMLEGRSFVTVALLRQLPSPGHLTNLFLGISPVSHHAFILGTLLGAIPSAVPAILIGSSTVQQSGNARLGMLAASLGFLAMVWVAGSMYFRNAERFKSLRP